MIDCLQFYKALENTENLNHIVDDLSQGVNHEDHGGDPEEKDIVNYNNFDSFQIDIFD